MQEQRACSNCGHELGREVRFCPNCGRPVPKTAHVPTPEADVPVPSPPVEQGDPVKVEWNTLVRTDEQALGLGTDAYVHVRGTVLGSFQGSDRAGQTDPFDYNLPKLRSGLQPGGETEDGVIFRRADPSQPLQVSFAWERGGFMDDRPEPLVFEVTP